MFGAGQKMPAVAPTGQMQEWQDRLGRLMSEADSEVRRPGPSQNLRKTLESLGESVSQPSYTVLCVFLWIHG